jgi:hypothetical protein
MRASVRMRKFKGPRPTLKTAHEFYRRGFHPPAPGREYFTEEEHLQQVIDIEDDLESIVRLQYPRTQNLEYAILKAHLIIEHSITQYIRAFARTADAKIERFSFSQKLDIAYLLGFGAHDPTMIPTVELLNRVRNQVAHSFKLDRSLVDELLRINSGEYPRYRPKNDRERIRGLKMMCAFISGFISGYVQSQYHHEKEQRAPVHRAR